MRVPAVIKPAAPCTPCPEITRDVQPQPQKGPTAPGEEKGWEGQGGSSAEGMVGDANLQLCEPQINPSAPGSSASSHHSTHLTPSQHPPHPVILSPLPIMATPHPIPAPTSSHHNIHLFPPRKQPHPTTSQQTEVGGCTKSQRDALKGFVAFGINYMYFFRMPLHLESQSHSLKHPRKYEAGRADSENSSQCLR